jgi:hypothetical protein
LRKIHKRTFLLGSAGGSLALARMKADETISDPWSKSELIEPADLVKLLNVSGSV